ncbi:MAG: HSP20 family protein [Bacteroidia bacterium]|jgi:HSP20 family protein
MTLTKVKPANSLFRDVWFPAGIDQWMNQFTSNELDTNHGNSFFKPSVDVVESEKVYNIHVSLPGVKKEDIKIDLKGNELTISGERTQKFEKTDATHHVGEIRYGKFTRTFYLNEQANHDEIEAKNVNGVLEVTIPKVEKALPKIIKIK